MNSLIQGDVTSPVFGPPTYSRDASILNRSSVILTDTGSGTCFDVLAYDDVQIYLQGEFTVRDVIVIPCEDTDDAEDTLELVYYDSDG